MDNPNQIDGYVSSNGMWAAVPYGKKYISIYNGEQICLHNTLETAKKFIQKEIRRKK
jgi:hypothetical protein